MAFVYILRCADGSLYAGAAKDLSARVRSHDAGRASRYTRGRLPVCLVWWVEVTSWGDALREEHRIKQLSRREKEALVALTPPAGDPAPSCRTRPPRAARPAGCR